MSPCHRPGNWLKEGDLPKDRVPGKRAPKWMLWTSMLEEGDKHAPC